MRRDRNDATLNSDGLAARSRTRTPSPSIRKLVTKLLLVVPSELPDVCRTAKAAPAVLGWLLDGDDDLSLFQLVLRFSWEDDLVKEAIAGLLATGLRQRRGIFS